MAADRALADHARIQMPAVSAFRSLGLEARTHNQRLHLLAFQRGQHPAQPQGAATIALRLADRLPNQGLQLRAALFFKDARRMLAKLSGRRHEVMTGICLKRGPDVIRDCATTEVWFTPMSEREIAEYIASGEPMDKAGAYAIQGLASKYIERIEGSYFNVMGLPVALMYRHLQGA